MTSQKPAKYDRLNKNLCPIQGMQTKNVFDFDHDVCINTLINGVTFTGNILSEKIVS